MKAKIIMLGVVYLLIFAGSLKAQNSVISGKVIDTHTEETLPGVNVLVKGTSTGTSTDANGEYELNVKSSQDTLVFSFVGYRTREIPIDGRTTVDMRLEPQTIAGEELVVVGYGSVQKSDLTGSISSLQVDDLNNQESVTNIDQLMQGKVAGVQINQSSAEPGGGASVRIRGASSINAGNSPLYVIDGLPITNNPSLTGTGRGITNNAAPRNPLNALNPADIESIEVLKDASATAIYGSRGANGVIMITTKKGIQNRLNVDYGFTSGFQEVMKKLDLLTAQEFANVLNDLREGQGEEPEFTQDQINSFDAGTNWQDQIFQTEYSQNHHFSLSGGNASTKYAASLGFYDEKGVVLSSGIKRYNAKLNLEKKVSPEFNFGVNLMSSKIKDDYVPFGNSFNAGAGVIGTAIQMDPTYPVYNDNGQLFQTADVDFDNPVVLAKEVKSNKESDRTFGNIFAEYYPIPDLKFKINVGYDRESARRDAYNPTTTKVGAPLGGIATIFTSEQESGLFEGTISYDKEIAKNSFNIVVGYSYQQDVNRGFSGNITGFPADATATNNLGLGDTEDDNLNSYKNSNTLISYFGRVNYSFDNKYLLTGSIRADGSSRFGENNKFGYFPSVALSWRLSEEEFMQDLEGISNLKLRGSWGATGNQSIGNYASLSTLSIGGSAVFNGVLVQGVAPDRFPNPELKWETTKQLNIGLDAGFLNDRINATVDYFVKTTDDLLLALPIPSTSGFESILQNIGSVRNNGIEVLVDFRNISQDNFTWNTTLNFSSVRNEVLDLGPISDIVTGNLPFTQGVTIIREGAPLNSYYGMEVTGIFQEGDDIANSAQPDAQPGYPKFKDINEDGTINDQDKTILGNPFPDFTVGFTNTINYQRFQLDFLVTGEYGAEILNQNLLESLYPIEFRRNRYAEPYLNRWTPENPTNKWPSGVNPTSYGGSTVNSLSIEDVSFIKLKNVKLSYSFDTQRISFVDRLNTYISVQNVLFLTDYRGFDPEVNVFGNSNVRADYNSYPAARTYSLGINVSF